MKSSKDILLIMLSKKKDKYYNSINDAVIKKINQIVNKLEIYYEICDIDNNTNFYPIFKTLYLSNEPTDYKTIADQFYIDIKTLYNYRKKFNKLALELLCEKGLDRFIFN